MPQEPYWEVTAYKEYGSQSAQVPASLVTQVGMAASSVITDFLIAIAGHTLDTLNDNVKSYLGKNMGVATLLRMADIASVATIIENELGVDYSIIINALKAGIGQGVGGVHASLYESISGTGALTSSYNGLVQRVGIDPYINRWVNNQIRPNIPDAETAWFMWKLGTLSDDKFMSYINQNGWDNQWLQSLNTVWTRPAPIGMLYELVRRGQLTTDQFVQQLRWYRIDEDIIQMLSGLVIQYPEPYRLAEMYSKGVIPNDIYYDTMRTFGMFPQWSSSWSEAQQRFPDFGTALALLRRGDIDESTFYFWMQRGQVSPEESEVMLKLKEVIPPIDDAIRFAVREAYLDHDPEKQYDEMVKIAGKMGLNQQAAEWYWYSHWTRIPLTQMFINYWRGYWTKEKLEHMLKIADIHPDDRQDIINVAYLPPSIREQGYGFDVGVYTPEDIKKYRMWAGLSPEDAEKSTQATIAYRTEAERNAVRTELMYAYGLGRIEKLELKKRIQALPTPTESLNLWLERAEWYRDRIKKPSMDLEGRIISSSEALTAFKLGLRDETWLRQALKNLDWTDDRIEVAVERAQIEKAEKETEQVEVKYRKLTLAQLRQMYNIRLITKEQMTTEIVLIGYTPDDAELLTEIYTKPTEVTAEIKPFTSAVAANMYSLMMFDEEDLYDNFLLQDWSESQAALLTMYTILIQEYPKLKIMYENGVISGEQFVQELMKLEMPEFNARALVKKTYDEIGIQRIKSEKDLTKAEIIKGVKNNVLTVTQGAELLQGIGYDESEAYYILAINKVVAAGDPESYWEMRKVTEQYKKAKGEKYVDIPDELLILDRQRETLRKTLDELKKSPEKEQEISDTVQKLSAVEQQIKQLVLTKGLK